MLNKFYDSKDLYFIGESIKSITGFVKFKIFLNLFLIFFIILTCKKEYTTLQIFIESFDLYEFNEYFYQISDRVNSGI